MGRAFFDFYGERLLRTDLSISVTELGSPAGENPGDAGDRPRDTGRPWTRSRWSSPTPSARPCASATCS
ncbi:hypothetical protein [Nonomuraea coxensis]|uniref:hypothetical protein n=1 Tax=Nonomuraea coxensis TaxID=404386 RepID=UPI003CCEC804